MPITCRRLRATLAVCTSALLWSACATLPPGPPPPLSCDDANADACFEEAKEAASRKDYARVRELYARGCALHDAESCLERADWQTTRWGGPRDDGLAWAGYGRACDLGSAAGCLRAGNFAELGRGGPRDEESARKRFGEACARQSKEGCFRLGQYEEFGRGGPADPDAAIARYRALCASGRRPACEAAEAARLEQQRLATPVEAGSEVCLPETGGLDRDVIHTVIRAHEAEVRHCYQGELNRGLKIEGKVTLVFIIGPDGTTTTAKAEDFAEGFDLVAQCIVSETRFWRFPPPLCGGLVTVTFPWTFKMAPPNPPTR